MSFSVNAVYQKSIKIVPVWCPGYVTVSAAVASANSDRCINCLSGKLIF